MGLFDFILPKSLTNDIRFIKSNLDFINQKLNTILMNDQEAIAKLTEVSNKLTKVGGETTTLLANVKDLKKALADAQAGDGTVTAALEEAINKVASQAQTVDELVPDITNNP